MNVPPGMRIYLKDVIKFKQKELESLERLERIRNDISSLKDMNPLTLEEMRLAIELDPKSLVNIEDPPGEIVAVALSKGISLSKEYLNSCSEDTLLSILTHKGSFITLVENPGPKAILAATHTFPELVEIERFKDKLYIESAIMKGYLKAVRLLDNPSKSIQLHIAHCDPSYLSYVKNPSEKVLEAAIKSSPEIILSLKNPSMELILEALDSDHGLINALHLTDEKLKEVIAKKPFLITKLNNPSYELKVLALSKNGCLLSHFKEQTEEMQLTAINNWGFAIQFISNPNKKLQEEALKYFMNNIETELLNPEEFYRGIYSKYNFFLDYLRCLLNDFVCSMNEFKAGPDDYDRFFEFDKGAKVTLAISATEEPEEACSIDESPFIDDCALFLRFKMVVGTEVFTDLNKGLSIALSKISKNEESLDDSFDLTLMFDIRKALAKTIKEVYCNENVKEGINIL